MRTVIKRIALVVGGFVAFLGVAVLVLVAIWINVNLKFLQGAIETTAGAALDRKVSVDGPVTLSLSFPPGIKVRDVKIANLPRGSSEHMLEAGVLRLSIALRPLLRGEIHLGKIVAKDVTLNLESFKDGGANWIFGNSAAGSGKEAPEREGAGGIGKEFHLVGLDKVALELITLNYRDGALDRSFSLTLDSLKGAVPQGKPIRFDIEGKAQDKPFDMTLKGDSLAGLSGDGSPWEVELSGAVAGTPIKAKGDIVLEGGRRTLRLEGHAGPADIGAVLARLGVLEGLEIRVGGMDLKLALAGGSLSELVRRSSMTFSIRDGEWTMRDRNTGEAIAAGDLAGDIRVEQKKPVAVELKGRINGTPVTILATGAPLAVLLGDSASWEVELSGAVAGTPIEAKGDIVLEGGRRTLRLEGHAGPADIGAVLARFGVLEGLEIGVGGMDLKLALTGASLSELVRRSSMTFSIREGEWTMKDRNTGEAIAAGDLAGDIRVEQKKPVAVELEGSINGTPVTILATGAPLADYVKPAGKVPLQIDIDIVQSHLSVAGAMSLPVSKSDLRFKMKYKGGRLDSFNELFSLHLPAIGPLALEGELAVTGEGYDLSALKLQVGRSTLEGSLNLKPSNVKTQLEIELVSSLIQIDDFLVAKSPPSVEIGDSAKAGPETEGGAQRMMNSLAEQLRRGPLSLEVPDSIDAALSVELRQVMWGKDRLGSGTMEVSLREGRLAFGPMQLAVPGGDVLVEFSLDPSESGIEVDVTAKTERLDIGILARAAKLETDMGGILTLDASLHSKTAGRGKMMADASGHFDFILWPENISAEKFDFWAINLMVALMKGVDTSKGSEMNCAMARLDIADGVMTERAIYLDTSQMRTGGDVKIDFNKETIYIRAESKAKKPKLFSATPPIKVEGTFSDLGPNIGATALVESTISLIDSPLRVPIGRLFGEDAPEDGSEACAQVWEKTGRGMSEKPREEDKRSAP